MPRRRTRIICSIGNLKVGKDTLIMNITSATDCPSRRRGLCQVPPGACYALKAEKRYDAVLPYRRRQNRVWDSLTAEEIAEDVKVLAGRRAGRRRKIPIRYLRMQEAGDFRHSSDVAKMSRIADLLSGTVGVYTYTARRDLFPTRTSSNLVVNGSGFMVDNNFQVVNKGALGPGPKCRGIKGGGCYGCPLCKVAGKRVIQEELRGSTKPVGDGKGGVPQHMDDTGDLYVEEGLMEVLSPATAAANGATPQKRKGARRSEERVPSVRGIA